MRPMDSGKFYGLLLWICLTGCDKTSAPKSVEHLGSVVQATSTTPPEEYHKAAFSKSANRLEEEDPQIVFTGHADVDPSNDQIIGPPEPLSDCEQRLQDKQIRFKQARIGLGKRKQGVYTCGAKQVVRFQQGPGNIKYNNSPLLTCTMALALADFERIVQEEAERILQTRVKKIDHLGTYNCRKMATYDLISEHSFANGIDLQRFHLANGKTINILTDFRPEEFSPNDPHTRFLRALTKRLFDENIFSVVLTPFFNDLHRNHIHVDFARYRVDGSRP